ncbi:hypothetical protein BD626DRAFT_219888 [Schizophyllum amplum]|uniref:Uncharacterized protein n=1 Tax=Schizophyllum amplum TaxID=97359 RepID=A0A550CL32_9AGAR|nr:hypothetical protein BD626DRAFT_219888 [Auriculariopsis ampla]
MQTKNLGCSSPVLTQLDSVQIAPEASMRPPAVPPRPHRHAPGQTHETAAIPRGTRRGAPPSAGSPQPDTRGPGLRMKTSRLSPCAPVKKEKNIRPRSAAASCLATPAKISDPNPRAIGAQPRLTPARPHGRAIPCKSSCKAPPQVPSKSRSKCLVLSKQYKGIHGRTLIPLRRRRS